LVAIAKRLDLRCGFDASIRDDPLKHPDSILHLLNLLTKANRLTRILDGPFPAVADVHSPLQQGEGENDEEDGDD
jgi:hypothetical protein